MTKYFESGKPLCPQHLTSSYHKTTNRQGAVYRCWCGRMFDLKGNLAD